MRIEREAAVTHVLRLPRWTWIRGIRARMLIFFVLVFVVSIAGLQWVQLYGLPIGGFEGQAAELRRDELADLSLIADLKKERLLLWLEERRGDVRVIADSGLISIRAQELKNFIREQESLGMADAALRSAVREHPASLELTQHLKLVATSYGVYESLGIVDAASRTIIASTDASHVNRVLASAAIDFPTVTLGATEMLLGLHAEEGAAHLIIARTMVESDGAPSGAERTATILLAEVNLDDMLGPMLHIGGGPSQTGEALLVDGDVRILTSLAHPLEDGSVAEPLEYEITAMPAVFAAQGEEGIIEARDYRGIPVLAAYRYIPITTETGWGLVVKRDETEVLASVTERIGDAVVIGGIGIGVTLIVVWVVASTISRPVRVLAAAARRVEGGDLDARARVGSSGEVGELAETFNAMVERVQGWNRELEEQVEQRTGQLVTTNEMLRTEVDDRTRAQGELTRLANELEQRVAERTAELASANEELEAFAYSVSHDLRAPLRATDGFSRILLEEHAAGLSEDGKRYLNYVREGAQRMGDLIDDLLAFSRLGRSTLSSVSVDPSAVARQALAELGPEQEGRRVEDTVEDMPVCRADPALLRQVYANLLSNALKFTRNRDVARIDVGSVTVKGEVVYFVRDNGIGFQMEYAERIFDVFQRLERQEDYEGTGIGLALVQRIVQRHGGRIWAEGEPDQGATIYFTLSEASDGGRNPD